MIGAELTTCKYNPVWLAVTNVLLTSNTRVYKDDCAGIVMLIVTNELGWIKGTIKLLPLNTKNETVELADTLIVKVKPHCPRYDG